MGDSEAAVGLDGLKDLEGAGGETKAGKKYRQVGWSWSNWIDWEPNISLFFIIKVSQLHQQPGFCSAGGEAPLVLGNYL